MWQSDMRSGRHSQVLSALSTVLLAAAVLFVAAKFTGFGSHAEEAHMIPPPAADAAANGATSEVAVLAGGCFWGVQGVFQHVKGVSNAVSGYAGGTKDTAHYQMV